MEEGAARRSLRLPERYTETLCQGLADAAVERIRFVGREGARRVAVVDGKREAGFSGRNLFAGVAVDQLHPAGHDPTDIADGLFDRLKRGIAVDHNGEVAFDWRERGRGATHGDRPAGGEQVLNE